MNKFIDNLEKQFNSLTKRDQISASVIVVVVVLFLWETLLRSPLQQDVLVFEHDITQINSEIVVMQAKINALQSNLNVDVDSATRTQLERFAEENRRLEQALDKTTVLIVNPQEMVTLLEQILRDQEGLKFISLNNLESKPEFVKERGDDAVTAAAENNDINTIYRHSVVLEMEGSYHDVLAYLKKLEKLPWRFFWQALDIETKDYPNTSVKLEVYTLGFRQGIIGV